MPVSFEAPQPFAPQISEQAGVTEQWNRSLPVLASLYEQNQNRNLAAAQGAANRDLAAQQATAHNRQAAYQTDVNTENEFEAQRRNYAIQSELQARQIQAHQQSQMFDAAVRDRQVGHAEMMDAQRAEAGLSQLQQDVESGLISKQEAADAAYFLRTKTDRVRQRVEAQHAEEYKAQAKQRMEEAGLHASIMRKNVEVLGKSSSENAALDPQAELLERDKLRPKYQALASVIGADAAQQAMDKEVRDNVIRQGQYRDLIGISSHGTPEYKDMKPAAGHNKDLFDSQLKHAESQDKRWQADQDRYDREYKAARAEANKLSAENGGWSQEKVKSETERLLADQGITKPGPRPALPTRPDATSASFGQTAPPNTPGQEAQAQNDQRGDVTQTIAEKSPAPKDQNEAVAQQKTQMGVDAIQKQLQALPPDRLVQSVEPMKVIGRVLGQYGTPDAITDKDDLAKYISAVRKLAELTHQRPQQSVAPAPVRPNNPSWYPGNVGGYPGGR